MLQIEKNYLEFNGNSSKELVNKGTHTNMYKHVYECTSNNKHTSILHNTLEFRNFNYINYLFPDNCEYTHFYHAAVHCNFLFTNRADFYETGEIIRLL